MCLYGHLPVRSGSVCVYWCFVSAGVGCEILNDKQRQQHRLQQQRKQRTQTAPAKAARITATATTPAGRFMWEWVVAVVIMNETNVRQQTANNHNIPLPCACAWTFTIELSISILHGKSTAVICIPFTHTLTHRQTSKSVLHAQNRSDTGNFHRNPARLWAFHDG